MIQKKRTTMMIKTILVLGLVQASRAQHQQRMIKEDKNKAATSVPSNTPTISLEPTSSPTKAPRGGKNDPVPAVPAPPSGSGATADTTPSAFPSTSAFPSLFPSGAPSEEHWVGGKFCNAPRQVDKKDPKLCKMQEDRWEEITADREITFYQRTFTQECGPDCRPSCVTLMLDLDKLEPAEELICEADRLCECEHSKCGECDERKKSKVFHKHPKCFLEDAGCLGATVFDDVVGYTQNVTAEAGLVLPELDQCTTIPEDDLYCRFQDWPLVTPMEFDCGDDTECFQQDNKVFFEFCNIVEEDPECDKCSNDKCGKNCKKITEPFPPGKTTFVVSASIPYETGLNDKCDKILDYADTTQSACFLQRIELYYPLEDDDCSPGCPHCHKCPLLNLGDTFGPLEVVGFGHALDTTCAACDNPDFVECAETELDCDALLACEESVECASGEPLGLAIFEENQCSFCDPDLVTESGGADTVDEEEGGTEDREETEEDEDEDRGRGPPVVTGNTQEYTADPPASFQDYVPIFISAGAVVTMMAIFVIMRKKLHQRAVAVPDEKKAPRADPRHIDDTNSVVEDVGPFPTPVYPLSIHEELEQEIVFDDAPKTQNRLHHDDDTSLAPFESAMVMESSNNVETVHVTGKSRMIGSNAMSI